MHGGALCEVHWRYKYAPFAFLNPICIKIAGRQRAQLPPQGHPRRMQFHNAFRLQYLTARASIHFLIEK